MSLDVSVLIHLNRPDSLESIAGHLRSSINRFYAKLVLAVFPLEDSGPSTTWRLDTGLPFEGLDTLEATGIVNIRWVAANSALLWEFDIHWTDWLASAAIRRAMGDWLYAFGSEVPWRKAFYFPDCVLLFEDFTENVLLHGVDVLTAENKLATEGKCIEATRLGNRSNEAYHQNYQTTCFTSTLNP